MVCEIQVCDFFSDLILYFQIQTNIYSVDPIQSSSPLQTKIEQFYSKKNSSTAFKEANNVSQLISSMAANFEVVDNLCDTVNGSNMSSNKTRGLSTSPTPPPLSPPITLNSSTCSR